MDALVGGEVQGTFSRSPSFGLALPRAQANQTDSENLANLGHALGGGHAIGIESVRQAGETFIRGAPWENFSEGATACQDSKRKEAFMQLLQRIEQDTETTGTVRKLRDRLSMR